MEIIHQDLILILILALFSVVLIRGSNGSLPAQIVYWNSHLSNTPIPKALQQLIQFDGGITSDFLKESSTSGFQRGQLLTYGTGYWSESKTFKKNQTFNTTTSTTVYFLQHDLHPYKKMNIIFTKSSSIDLTFLPNKVAKSIPFSSSKLPEILNKTSIKPNSKEAQVMKQTLEECEAPGIIGEDKYCATSLESLVDYVVSKLGNRVQTLSNEVERENKKQVYRIQNDIKMMGQNGRMIVCHKERYAYAVYYFHKISDTQVYMIGMRGEEDGSKAKAAVVCHLDTSTWNPKHFAFQVLNVKPGGPPVCHFLNSDTIVWLPN